MKKILFLLAFLPMLAFGQQITQQSKTPSTGASAGNQYFGWWGGVFNGYLIFPYGTNFTVNRQAALEGQTQIVWADSTFKTWHNGSLVTVGGRGGASSSIYINGLQFKNNGSVITSPLSLQTDTLKTARIYYLGFDPSTKALRYDTTQFGAGSGIVKHANNGLHLSGDTVQLGGGMTQNAIVDLALKYLKFDDVTHQSVFLDLQPSRTNPQVFIQAADSTSGNGGTIILQKTASQFFWQDPSGNLQGLRFDNALTATDNFGSIGIQNSADYSTNIKRHPFALVQTNMLNARADSIKTASNGVLSSGYGMQSFSYNPWSGNAIAAADTNKLAIAPDEILTGMVTTLATATNAQTTAGTARIGQVVYTYSLTNNTVPAQDATLRRYSIIYATPSSTILILNGTLATDPQIPDVPGGDLLVSIIYIPSVADGGSPTTTGGGGKGILTLTFAAPTALFTVTGSPATKATSNIAMTLKTQASHTIWGVSVGSTAAPAFFTPGTLTLSTGLTGTSYTIFGATTAKVDTTVIQTTANFFPKGDTRYLKISSAPTGANPTATIGFTVVNGSATTFTRSDGAPKADSTVIRSVANSYSLSGMQTKLNNYVNIASPQLTTSSTVNYVWTATNTSGNGSWQAASSGGSPGSPTNSIQFNNSGSFGGDSNFIWDNTKKAMGLGGNPIASRSTIIGTSPTLTYPYSLLWGFGDSITTGTGASPSSNAYFPLTATAIGVTNKNKALSGNYAADEVDSVYTAVPGTTTQLYTYMIGTNDANNYTTANQSLNYQTFIQEAMAYLTIPNANKVFGQSGSVTYTGTWTNATFYGGAVSKVSQTNGSTATFSVTGSTIYIAYTIQDANGGTFSLTVDGVSQGSFNSTGVGGATINTSHGRNYGSALLRLTGFSSGSHTCVITVTSSTSSSNKVWLDWAATNNGAGTAGWPALYQLNISINAITQTPLYNNIIASSVKLIAGDGLNVKMIDAAGATANYTAYSSDGIHPNNAGHAQISKVLLSAINVAADPNVNTTQINSSTGVVQQVVSNTGFLGAFTNAPYSPVTIYSPNATYDVSTSSTPIQPIYSFYNSAGNKTNEIRTNVQNNLSIGIGAMSNITQNGSNNIHFGFNAGENDTTGSNNFSAGYQALYNLKTANNTIAIGYWAGYNTDGNGAQTTYGNIFLGYTTGYHTTTGYRNIFLGAQAGVNNTTGFENIYIGQSAGNAGTTGTDNVLIGQNAGAGISASFVTSVGYNAGGGSANSNAFFGYVSGQFNSSGGNNAFFGAGSGDANTTGGNNTYLGFSAGQGNSTGGSNVAIGTQAGQNDNSSQNVLIGKSVGNSINSSGGNNVAIGYQAAVNSSPALTTIDNSVFVGYQATASANSVTNVIALGASSSVPASNWTSIGNSSTVDAQVYGAVMTRPTLTAVNATATLSAAQMAAGYITSTSTAATTLTTPTATALATQMTATRGTSYFFTIDNTLGANTVTLALDASFTQLTVGSSSLTVPSGTTGIGTWKVTFVSTTAATISRIE